MSTLKAKVRRQFVKVMGKDMYVAHTLPAAKIGMDEMIRLAAEDSGMTEAMVAAMGAPQPWNIPLKGM